MTSIAITRTPYWIWIVALLGLAWNVFGAVQFIGSLGQTVEGLTMGGMTAEQARVYKSLPAWSTIAFALGTFGGIAGSVALLLRRAIAVPIFVVSLIAYVALFAADYVYGLFAAIPSQLAILTTVVLIAAALLGVSLFARGRGVLR